MYGFQVQRYFQYTQDYYCFNAIFCKYVFIFLSKIKKAKIIDAIMCVFSLFYRKISSHVYISKLFTNKSFILHMSTLKKITEAIKKNN